MIDLKNSDPTHSRPKYFQLEMFPYPSGAGLHMGHVLSLSASDIRVRFLRLYGYDVLHAMGFDSFGLPAEQFALQTGQHPEITTANNIKNMTKQLQNLQLSYDWSKTFATSDRDYYRWTQWIFLQMYDSFFDHTENWTDRFGNVINGKAKHIDVLRTYLRNGIWYINNSGIPVPTIDVLKDASSNHNAQTNANHNAQTKYTDAEIEQAIDKKRLTYLDEALVNWCPKLGTVLANEEVKPDGTSERGGFPVEKRYMKQWMMRITDYADRLSSGFDQIDWPEKTVTMQKNWIGSSVGYKIEFHIDGTDDKITVFTTKPETLFGVTFLAIAQDYPKYGIACDSQDSINDMSSALKSKTGAFTGMYAVHPLTSARIPIWSANYVVRDYGTGAVMGVPDRDDRDREFAEQYNIPIIHALLNDTETHIHNPSNIVLREYRSIFNALPEHILKQDLINTLTKLNIASIHKTYKLRDWLFSRQRYWGEPFPIVYDVETGKCYPLDESELPVQLPYVNFETLSHVLNEDANEIFTPLSTAHDWVKVYGQIRNGKVTLMHDKQSSSVDVREFRREINTMPNWAGSCWYYLRYMAPHNTHHFCTHEEQLAMDRAYASADYYIGGSEHTVLHLLYSRFWHMFLYDMGFAISPEPFMTLRHQGMINAYSYRRNDYSYVKPENVCHIDGNYYDTADNAPVTRAFGKMGKSLNNSVDPDEFIKQYGNDVLRAFIHFMGPIEHDRVWTDDGISGIQRFLAKVERMVDAVIERGEAKSHHSLNQKRTNEIHQALISLNQYAVDAYKDMRLNTLLAKCMEFVNLASGDLSVEDARHFLIILSPIAINLTNRLYQRIKMLYPQLCTAMSIENETWPVVEAMQTQNTVQIKLIKKNKVLITIDVNAEVVKGIWDMEHVDQIRLIYSLLASSAYAHALQISCDELVQVGHIYHACSVAAVGDKIFVKYDQ